MNRFYYGNALQCRTEWVLGGCSTQARSFGGPAPSWWKTGVKYFDVLYITDSCKKNLGSCSRLAERLSEIQTSPQDLGYYLNIYFNKPAPYAFY